MSINIVKENFANAQQLLNEFVSNGSNFERIEAAGQIMVSALNNGNKIFTCGNGGSMSDAMHFAEELTGRFRENRKGMAAIAISDPTHITCVGNDFGFDYIFSRYVEAVGRPGDVLLAISTSGKSENILKAAEQAHHNKMQVLVLTAVGDNPLTHLAEVSIRAPHAHHSDRIQEIHIKVIHTLIQLIEAELGPTF